MVDVFDVVKKQLMCADHCFTGMSTLVNIRVASIQHAYYHTMLLHHGKAAASGQLLSDAAL